MYKYTSIGVRRGRSLDGRSEFYISVPTALSTRPIILVRVLVAAVHTMRYVRTDKLLVHRINFGNVS